MIFQLTNELTSDLSKEDLLLNLVKKLLNFFEISKEEKILLEEIHEKVLERLTICISNVDNKYFKQNNKAFFSYVHSGQYLMYLYFFSNELNVRNVDLMSKIYYLNKILHGVDIYGAIKLPEVFFFEHPLGMVLGRAVYGQDFFAMQGCTVGGNKGCYPSIGAHVKMYSNSKILGKCTIGNNVILAANTYIKDTDILDNSLVFGSSPNLIIKKLPSI